MQRLSLSEFIITIALLLGAAFAINYGLQSWLLNLNQSTTQRMERAGRIYK
jgi:hypothetical protein